MARGGSWRQGEAITEARRGCSTAEKRIHGGAGDVARWSEASGARV
jgi:hypothetical protein